MRQLLILVLFIAVTACTKRQESQGISTSPKIVATNYPIYFFATSLAGDLANISLPTSSSDPAWWKPKPEDIEKMQQADLILTNGAGYESWLERVSLPASKIRVTADGFRDKWIEEDEYIHSHGDEGAHSHGILAYNTWLDFKLAQHQLQAVCDALTTLLPSHKDVLESKRKGVESILQKLDKRMQIISEKLGNRAVITSHPVYQYLGPGYNIRLINMHWEPDEMPADAEWASFEYLLSAENAVFMIWEDEPNNEIQLKLYQQELKFGAFHVCGGMPKTGDFFTVMEDNLARIDEALSITH